MQKQLLSYLLIITALICKITPLLSSELTVTVYLLLYAENASIQVATLWIAGDLLYAVLHHTTVFGNWTIFTYGSILLIMIILQKIDKTKYSFITINFLMIILYWILTNFATWCITTIYLHSIMGIINCYIFALPFLATSLLGALIWSSIIVLISKNIKNVYVA